jgi:hypothetical protein
MFWSNTSRRLLFTGVAGETFGLILRVLEPIKATAEAQNHVTFWDLRNMTRGSYAMIRSEEEMKI